MSLSDWVAVTNLVVAVVALVVSGVAMYIALRTMNDAEEDWKQRKWYDLYFAAAQPYDLLDQFRKVYPRNVGTLEKNRAWNDAMMSLRQSHALATAFPKTDVIDAFFSASDFSNPDYAFDDERMRKLGDAVEGLRQKALLKPIVLEQRTGDTMRVNTKRGLNRLFVVFSVMWAIYVLVVFPIQRQQEVLDLSRSESQNCYQQQLGRGQQFDDCLKNAQAIANSDTWSLRAYYSNNWWLIAIAVFIVPVLFYGVCRGLVAVFFWVWRGFQAT